MAYIGKDPAQFKRALHEKDTFTGDGSTTIFDLTSDASSANEIQVFVDNIRQEPGASDAYTLGEDGSGNLRRITFTAAPDNGAEIYVLNPKTIDSNLIVPSDNSVTEAKIVTGAVTSTKILDGTIVNADINACAAISDTKLGTISTACKVATSSISQPGSSGVYLAGDGSWGAIDTSQQDTNAFNISLLGFKMAVNEGLTVFNLVDGVVDEFNDESGTDEAEGSNDTYFATCDFYQNAAPVSISAGFTMTTVTEPDTSSAGNNPTQGTATSGTFTVPSSMTSADIQLWGAGGGRAGCGEGAGGGYVSGTLATTPGQVLHIIASEGGLGGSGTPTGVTPGGTKGGAVGGGNVSPDNADWGGGGGGLALVSSDPYGPTGRQDPSPRSVGGTILVAGGGGGGANQGNGGSGGGLTGCASEGGEQTAACAAGQAGGGGGDQEQGGQGGIASASGQTGVFLAGGNGAPQYGAGGGSGFYGGGGGGSENPTHGGGGGGSSYYGHPQITSGTTEEGNGTSGSGGNCKPDYVPGTGNGGTGDGQDGYALIIGTAIGCTTSTTIVSEPFTSTSVPTSARIVVFEENVDTPTLNTDIVASISRDGGSTFTNATLSDSGYVTGSSGQRILTGQATISGQPSGQSMRWKLALANNTVKIHGVSLQWA